MALPISESQVLIDVFGDEGGMNWHGRILLERLNGEGRWIAASPDLEIGVLELGAHRVIPLMRNMPFPRRVAAHEVYFFDPADITEDALRDLHSEARSLCSLMGGTPMDEGPADATWVYADTGTERFGDEVSADVLRIPGSSHIQGSIGIVAVEGGWAFIELVRVSDFRACMDSKRTGAGRDPRLGGALRGPDGSRFATVVETMGFCREDAAGDWPFRGPRSVKELIVAVHASGHSWSGYHNFVIEQLGMSPNSAVAHNHGTLLALLELMASYDQMNLYNLAAADLAARHVLRIHKAVRKNPKNPDFSGLDIMIAHNLDTAAGVSTGEFSRFIAEEQKAEAFTLKQQRLAAEEAAKRAGSSKDGGAGNSK